MYEWENSVAAVLPTATDIAHETSAPELQWNGWKASDRILDGWDTFTYIGFKRWVFVPHTNWEKRRQKSISLAHSTKVQRLELFPHNRRRSLCYERKHVKQCIPLQPDTLRILFTMRRMPLPTYIMRHPQTPIVLTFRPRPATHTGTPSSISNNFHFRLSFSCVYSALFSQLNPSTLLRCVASCTNRLYWRVHFTWQLI